MLQYNCYLRTQLFECKELILKEHQLAVRSDGIGQLAVLSDGVGQLAVRSDGIG
jgi:hypothetical protein